MRAARQTSPEIFCLWRTLAISPTQFWGTSRPDYAMVGRSGKHKIFASRSNFAAIAMVLQSCPTFCP